MQVGIDIEEVNRFSEIERDKNKLNKLFTKDEQEYFNRYSNKTCHIAGFFCAKEAVSKALKVSLYRDIYPINIEILHGKNGEPFVNLENVILKKLLNNKKIDISISHTDKFATAICIIF